MMTFHNGAWIKKVLFTVIINKAIDCHHIKSLTPLALGEQCMDQYGRSSSFLDPPLLRGKGPMKPALSSLSVPKVLILPTIIFF